MATIEPDSKRTCLNTLIYLNFGRPNNGGNDAKKPSTQCCIVIQVVSIVSLFFKKKKRRREILSAHTSIKYVEENYMYVLSQLSSSINQKLHASMYIMFGRGKGVLIYQKV